jgi:hypothetical protein
LCKLQVLLFFFIFSPYHRLDIIHVTKGGT